MSRRSFGVRVRVLASLVAVAALLLPSLALPVRAADVTFGTPAAKSSFKESITFTVPVSASATLERAELWLRFPDTIGPLITVVAPPSGGSGTLAFTLDLTGGSHLVPNTTLEATWAAYPTAAGDPVLSRTQTVHYEDTEQSWKSLKGELVTVHWYEGSDAFARKALKIGDDAVARTAQLLGVTETDPIDFYIYADDTTFRAALGPGTRENVGGQAHADIRTLFALIGPDAINDPWVGIVIPHELTHLVFDTAVRNPYRFPPRWLNEGLAVYLSESYGNSDRSLVKQAVRDADLLPLTALGGQFPTDAQKTYLAYAESVSAIDYLVKTDGQKALLALVAAYKDGLTDDEAFTRALGRDLAAFQDGWRKDLGADTPQQYGPQPNPAGPVPPGWGQPLASAQPGSTPGAATQAPGAATQAPGAASQAPGATASPGTPGRADDDGISGTAIAVVVIALVFAALFVGLVVKRRSPGGR